MAHVKSIIRLNPGKLKKLSDAQLNALAKTTDLLAGEIKNAQVIPRDTGTLENEGTFVDYTNLNKGTCSIVSSTPYARRLYYHPEYNFSTSENPNARGKWFEPWLKGGGQEKWVKETYKALYKQEAGL